MAADNTTTSLVWLPQTKAVKRTARSKQDQGWFQLLKQMPDNEFYMWKLIESSLPPLLARKYHIVNVAELMKDEKDSHYMGVATWFVMWSQAFGLQHLNSLHLEYEHLTKLKFIKKACTSSLKKTKQVEKNQAKWKHDADETLKCMNEARTVETAPTLKDNATTASGFLLEPCVIVQLPWNNVLFHQWLAAALVEVLVFEKSSLELRHWPLPPELEPTARELLTVVRQLKERVVLGFAIMSQQVVSHPKLEESHPGWIMDEVVLPSLATLQFLTTGKAYTILKSIKKLAWSNHCNVIGRVYVSKCAYCMDSYLEILLAKMCYNIPFFDLCLESSYPLPQNDCKKSDLQKVIKRINLISNPNIKENVSKWRIPFDRKDLSYLEETMIITINVKQKVSKYPKKADEKVDLVFLTVKKLIEETGRIAFAIERCFSEEFRSEARKTLTPEYTSRCTNNTQALVQHTMMYWEVHGYLVDSEKEQNVFARIVFLQLEIVEREQIIRLANLAACTCSVNPVAIKLDKSPPMTTQSMTQTLEEVRKKREGHTRDWLWTQFPVEWRKPVSVKEPALQLSLGTSVIVKLCEERIGRMVFNVARSSFGVFEKGGEVFPHWQTVQYILPCFVASFVELMKQPDEMRNENRKPDMLKLLDGILQFHETNFQNWITKVEVREASALPLNSALIIESQGHIKELHSLISYYINVVNYILTALVGSLRGPDKPLEGIFGLKTIFSTPSSWPSKIFDGEFESLTLTKSCKTWCEMSLQFVKNLYQIIINIWDISSHIKQFKNHIQEIFTVALIIDVLAIMSAISYFYKTSNNVPIDEKYADINIKINEFLSDVHSQSLYELFSDVILSDFICGIRILESAETSRLNSATLYRLIKMNYQLEPSIICKMTVEHLPSKPPELKIAAQHYINGNFTALDKMLKVLIDPNEKPLPKAEPPKSSSEKTSGKSVPKKLPPKKVRPKKVEAEGPFEKCRNCPKTERKWGPFLTCEQCVEQKYPDVNFFCSKKCQQERWAAEHMAEHLEFELGLADFSHLSLK